VSIRTEPWPAGTPCWTGLTAPDVDRAIAFYSAVVGWSFGKPDEEYGGYAIGSIGDAAAAGIGPQLSPDQPTAWTLYFAGDDADATARAVSSAGGQVLLAPGDVGTLGRMFIAADPTGAVFGVWQAGTHIGAGITNEPGGMSWEDLRSSDPDTARTFYRSVFGFDAHPLDMAGPDYTTFHLAGEEAPLGGVGGMMGAPEGTPSHWLVYFAVANADAAVAAATSAGGTSLAPPFTTTYGRMAPLQDPFGAPLWLVELPGSS
jgi:uncharacterized protein